jgi:MoaA/NifB/PqqE/SkfB family radical SAM enzyme
MDFQSLKDVWSSPSARELQNDIDSQRFSHCAVGLCDIQNHSIHMGDYHVSINIDESCNLWCPSCRKGKIMINDGEEHDRKRQQAQHIVALLEQFDQPCTIVMSGNGDPLASSIMRPLIQNFQPTAKQKIRLFTNGLLLRKQLENSSITKHIKMYTISIDAGSKEVYEQVRLGGKWEILLDNLEFLKDLARDNMASVTLILTVQRANHHDLKNFSDLCIKFGFKGSITKLDNWGTWMDFAAEDVIGNVNHPEHAAALQNLRDTFATYYPRIGFAAPLIELSQS